MFWTCGMNHILRAAVLIWLVSPLMAGLLKAEAHTQTRGTNGAPINQTTTRSIADVQVWVEGPWSYGTDPANSSRIVLVAPNLSDHLTPSVGHALGEVELSSTSPFDTLEITNYVGATLKCEPPSCQVAASYDPTDGNPSSGLKTDLINLLKKAGGRFIVSMPRPDFIEDGKKAKARVGHFWPPQAGNSTEASFSNVIVLHYSVSGLDGFTLDHKKYGFEGQNHLFITMNPTGRLTNPCDFGSRMAFKRSIALFPHLTAFIDLKRTDNDDYDPDCQSNEPQKQGNSAMSSIGTLSSTLEDLRRYILRPSPDKRTQAKEEILLLRVATKVAERDPDFEPLATALEDVRKFTELSEPKGNQIDSALQSLETLESGLDQRTSFHDGAGACRMPLIYLNTL